MSGSRVLQWAAPGRLRVWRLRWGADGFEWSDPAADYAPESLDLEDSEGESILTAAHRCATRSTKRWARGASTSDLFSMMDVLVDLAEIIGDPGSDPGALQVQEAVRLAYWRCRYELADRARYYVDCPACGARARASCRNRSNGTPIASTHDERLAALARLVDYLAEPTPIEAGT